MSSDIKEYKFPKFKRGDKVEYLGSPAEVITYLRRDDDTGENRYEVKSTWSGFVTAVTESKLVFYTGYLKEKIEVKDIAPSCPKCGSEWTVTGFGASKWKDCLKCKKKAEDISW